MYCAIKYYAFTWYDLMFYHITEQSILQEKKICSSYSQQNSDPNPKLQQCDRLVVGRKQELMLKAHLFQQTLKTVKF